MRSHWSSKKGGAELQAKYIASYLESKEDIEIHYICRNFEKPFGSEQVYKLQTNIFSKYTYAADRKQVLSILSDINPDFIYQRVLCAFTGIAAWYCKNTKCQMIFHIANSPDVKPSIYKLGKKLPFDVIENKWREYGIKNADYIISQAEYQDTLLKKNYTRESVFIMPNISPDVGFSNINKNINDINVLWVANIKKQKGPEIYLELAKSFCGNKNIKFHMVGRVSTPFAKRIQTQVEQLENVIFHGELPVDNVNKLMSKSLIFVNTSEYEGFANTFIQAWINETMVLSLNQDPDGIMSKNGLGLCCNNEKNLHATLAKWVENAEQTLDRGKQCRPFALKYFSISNAEKIYRLVKQNATNAMA